MTYPPRAIPPDRLRSNAAPTAPAWAVARGLTPRSHYVVTETWADLDGRYAAVEIVARGLTRADAEQRARRLNDPCACDCATCSGAGTGAGA